MDIRAALTVIGLALAGNALAQAPDVRFKLDLSLTERIEQRGRNKLRLYDPMGRPGTVSLTFFLEPGLRAFASQRLERIKGGPSNEFLDEAYVEDEGIWRVGKQYLPFGFSRLFAESVPALRADSNLIFEGVAISLAACDAGRGYQQGYVVRIGSESLNGSVAVGRNFGISGTSLSAVRRPEDAPGVGRGYRRALGVEAARRTGKVSLRLAAVALAGPEAAVDRERNIYDLSLEWKDSPKRSFSVGFSQIPQESQQWLRLAAAFQVGTKVTLEPMLRNRNGGFYDFNLTLRYRF